jgi:hypothetical protein
MVPPTVTPPLQNDIVGIPAWHALQVLGVAGPYQGDQIGRIFAILGGF